MDQTLVNKIIEYIEKTENFISTEMPDIVAQTLAYKKASCISGIISCSFLLILAISIFLYALLNPVYEKYGAENRTVFSFMGCIFPLFFMPPLILGLISEINSYVKLTIAPKVVLLEYFMSLKG